jgi:hypothetical protein
MVARARLTGRGVAAAQLRFGDALIRANASDERGERPRRIDSPRRDGAAAGPACLADALLGSGRVVCALHQCSQPSLAPARVLAEKPQRFANVVERRRSRESDQRRVPRPAVSIEFVSTGSEQTRAQRIGWT